MPSPYDGDFNSLTLIVGDSISGTTVSAEFNQTEDGAVIEIAGFRSTTIIEGDESPMYLATF